jgi:hypothetical protein
MNISSWTAKVPQRQWAREDRHLGDIGAALPESIRASRPLGEVHRLDLSLFVIFEEAALRVSGALTRRAPTMAAMQFAAQQTLDEARHHEVFLTRLGVSCGLGPGALPAVSEEIMIPPLRRFLERSYEVVDRGEFVEGLTLMNLIFEGMSYPLYAYEQRYWAPIDPYLTRLVQNAFADESRHVALGADLVRELLAGETARKNGVRALVRDMTALMNEVFAYYVRKFVKLFDAVARRHADLFAGAEFAPGALISATPYQDQIAAIHASITEQHAKIVARAGLA